MTEKECVFSSRHKSHKWPDFFFFFLYSFWPDEPLAFLIKNECEGVREKTRSGEELVNA